VRRDVTRAGTMRRRNCKGRLMQTVWAPLHDVRGMPHATSCLPSRTTRICALVLGSA